MFDTTARSHEPRAVRQIQCDLRNLSGLKTLIRTVVDLTGPVSYLVNAAADTRCLGPTFDALFYGDDTAQQWQVNVAAPLMLASALFHQCWKSIPVSAQDAAILNISSVSGRTVFDGTLQATYAAGKAALDMATWRPNIEFTASG